MVVVNTVTVPTSGTVPNSSTVTFNSAGTFYWQAVYSGDANNYGASSPCTSGSNEQLTVTNKPITHVQDAVSGGIETTSPFPVTLSQATTVGDTLILTVGDDHTEQCHGLLCLGRGGYYLDKGHRTQRQLRGR